MKKLIAGAMLYGLTGLIGIHGQVGKISDSKKIVTTRTSKDIVENFSENLNFENKNLSSLVFEGNLSLGIFNERIAFTSYIIPKIIERKQYNELKGNILIKKGTNTYELFFPNDLKVSELSQYIITINTTTFGETLPEYSSAIQLKKEMKYIIGYLLSIKNPHDKKILQTTIKNCKKLFDIWFPGEKISGNIYENNIDQSYIKNFAEIGDSHQLDKDIEEKISEILIKHLFESFFDMGSKMMGDIGNIKEKIGMKDLQKHLHIARKHKENDLIVGWEKQVAKKLLIQLDSFAINPKQVNTMSNFDKSIPSKVLETYNSNCVSLLIVAHQILSECGIHHEVKLMDNHIYMSLLLSDDNEYIFNPTRNPIKKQKLIDSDKNYELVAIGEDTLGGIKSPSKNGLMAAILFNKSKDVGLSLQEQVAYLELAVYLYGAENDKLYKNLELLYKQTGQYDKAQKYIIKERIIKKNMNIK